MSKIFKLKSWVTVGEAAEHLSLVFKEPVSTADIYRLALEGHLTISAHFVNFARGQLGALVGMDEAPFSIMPGLRQPNGPLGRGKEFNASIPRKGNFSEQLEWMERHADILESGEYVVVPHGFYWEDKGMLVFKDEIFTIRDVWDLSMLAAEALDVQHMLLQEVGGPALTLTNLEGVILVHPDGNRYARLMEHMSANEYAKDGKDPEKYPLNDPKSYYPAGGIPADAPLVVRTAAIAKFIETVSSSESLAKPLRADAKQTYERIIAALWAKARAGTGPGRLAGDPYTAGESLANLLAENNLETPSADKIGRVLAAAKGQGVPIGS